MSIAVDTIDDVAPIVRQAEASYPGGDLAMHRPLALRHVALVARWIEAGSRDAAAAHPTATPLSAPALSGATRFVSGQQLREVSSPVRLTDGAGAVLLPSNEVLLALDYPLYTVSGLARHAHGLNLSPLNPLVALRWSLTDLLLRLNAPNAPLTLTVVDAQGAVVPVPYAHGFAIGTGALYTGHDPYGQPTVNVGFDVVAVKVLAAALSARSGLSYVADVTTMAPFAPYLTPLRRLLAANGIAPAMWQALYQSSAVLDAVFALIERTHRRFGPDANPTHVGANTDRNAYGYGIMKAISERDSGTLNRALGDYTLPSLPSIPTVMTL